MLWRLTRGYRLRPWRSPYLRWRMETYWGMPADRIGFAEFWKFAWAAPPRPVPVSQVGATFTLAAQQPLNCGTGV